MYIFKNAFVNITRNKGRNILIAIIIMVIAASCAITLSIRNSANKIVKAYEEKYDVEATISMDRKALMSALSEQKSQEDMIEAFNKMDGLTQEEIDKYGDSDIGIVFQSYNLLPYLKASENIILSMDINHYKGNKKKRAEELLESVGLTKEHGNRKVLRLSGGEQQRVAIARSLSYNPKIIIADEPTGNLDKETESEILDIFEKLAHEEDKCVIIVTHSDNVSKRCDKVYDLKKTKDSNK